jgi:hypothetical protein
MSKDAAIAICVVAACAALVFCALILTKGPEGELKTKSIPPGWSCTTDLIPKVSAPRVFLLTDPQGQQFLMTSGGWIIPYTPKATVEKPKE